MQFTEPYMNLIPKRRWYQFSLRSLLLLTTATCVVMAWIAYERGETSKREAAAAELRTIARYEQLGLRVTLIGGEPWHEAWRCPTLDNDSMGKVVEARFYRENATDDDFAILEPMKKMESLHLDHTKATGAGLVHIAGLANVKKIYFNKSPIDDANLVHILGLNNLVELNLYHTNVTDAGLVHVARLTKLKRLTLDYTSVTDAGLIHLAQLTELKTLQLSHTFVTDAGLCQLAGLTKLEDLDLCETKVTEQGEAAVRKLLPKVCVRRY